MAESVCRVTYLVLKYVFFKDMSQAATLRVCASTPLLPPPAILLKINHLLPKRKPVHCKYFLLLFLYHHCLTNPLREEMHSVSSAPYYTNSKL